MHQAIKSLKFSHIISALAVGGFAFTMLNGNNPPLFNNLDNFALFAQEEVRTEQEVQISSGDVGSNKKIDIDKDVIVTGNLFAKEVAIDKNSTINGNASFNNLKLHKEAQILGTQIKPVSLPIANFPDIPNFQVGTDDFKFTGQDNILAAGNYRNIVLEKNARLHLSGGIYNMSKLFLEEGVVLIFSAAATLNIRQELFAQQNVSILPDRNVAFDGLIINYLGKRGNDRSRQRDQGIAPIQIGKRAFLNMKLLAPSADIHIGEEATIRGQVVARKIRIGKGTVVSRDIASSLQPRPADIITTDEGASFVKNQVIIKLVPNAAISDAMIIAKSVNGSMIGIIPSINLYQLLVPTETVEELENTIEIIKNNSLVKVATKNNMTSLIIQENE